MGIAFTPRRVYPAVSGRPTAVSGSACNHRELATLRLAGIKECKIRFPWRGGTSGGVPV